MKNAVLEAMQKGDDLPARGSAEWRELEQRFLAYAGGAEFTAARVRASVRAGDLAGAAANVLAARRASEGGVLLGMKFTRLPTPLKARAYARWAAPALGACAAMLFVFTQTGHPFDAGHNIRIVLLATSPFLGKFVAAKFLE